MNEFKTYHPIINFVYFVFVIGFSCFFSNPICVAISLVSGFLYIIILKGSRYAKKYIFFIIITLFAMSILNPLFNHRGATIIGYFPSGNPLTIESIIYGIVSASMIISVIFWFSCYNEIMTSDKFLYLFGKSIPSVSLVLSMTLRFVPKFFAELKVIINAQKCIGRDISCGNIVKRFKNGIAILSIMITWCMENAIETADSMKARGYGSSKRIAYSYFEFDKRDFLALIVILTLGIYIVFGLFMNRLSFYYFPVIKKIEFNVGNVCFITAYTILFVCPVIIEVWEEIRWKYLKSKI